VICNASGRGATAKTGMKFAFSLALLFLAFAVAMARAEPSGGRIALVIGNGVYANVETLKNPVRDAIDVGAKLEDLGFEVVLGIDTNRAQFDELLARARGRATDATAVVFYFAGHGFELSGSNRLVPVDAKLRDRSKINNETININGVIESLSGPGHQLVVLLDACRNNPPPKGVKPDTEREGPPSQPSPIRWPATARAATAISPRRC
jgi:uncharacterized caspase-like protein